MAATLIDRLFRRTAPAAPPTPPPSLAPGGEAALRERLAEKLLQAWMANRQQLRVPLTLNLARLPPPQAALLTEVMRATLEADGRFDEADRQRLAAALRRLGDASPADAARPLQDVLADVEAAGIGAQAYAAAALVSDARRPVERAFLDWLAARLALPPDLVAELARRYRR
jgi:uncharacterized membrane protein YebE (DUF533 family)